MNSYRGNSLAELLLFRAGTPAGVAAGEPPDAGERERALDVRASWIVEAPAGSGKTGLLIQRYLKLLADESVEQPEQVLAITFTIKATREMRDRVLAQLAAAAEGTEPTREFDRQTRPLAEAVLGRSRAEGWDLLNQPRRLNIRTIDSVCAEIARLLPVLSGAGGRLAPTLEFGPLYQEAARRTLALLGGGDATLSLALASLLQHRDGNLAECERLIAAMLGWRDQWGTLIPLSEAALEEAALDQTVLPRFERALELAICQALTQLTHTISDADLRDLTDVAAELAHLDGYKGGVSPIAFCANRSQPPGDRVEHLEHWRALVHLVVTPSSGTWRKSFTKNVVSFETGKLHHVRLKALVDQLQRNEELLRALCRLNKLPPARYPPEQWTMTKLLFRVMGRALVELQLVFAERGQCDFTELGLAARTALTRDSGVDDLSAALGARTRHLLVDEMQDTSTSQYDLIGRLTRSWDGHSQTVFLVGDPKQSIYRFRQARVERFVRTLHERRLGDLPLGVLRLIANFRSQPGLVNQFNSTFSRIFPAAVNLAHPEDVPYVASIAAGGILPAGEGLAWHAEAIPYTPDPAARSRVRRDRSRRDAQTVREIAMHWLGRPLPANRSDPWRIAVLVRSRIHLTSLVAAFQRTGDEGAVPFRAVEIEPLGERQEVLDLKALTRALLHPADRVAWLAILHAPWCGLTLGDLHRLVGQDDPSLRERCVADLIRERGHLLSAEGEERVARLWPILSEADGQRGRIPLAERVERTWHSLGGDAYLTGQQRENANRFFRLLEEIATGGGRLDLALLEARMKKLYADPVVHPGAVDLMTIHAAKGLEWDVVVVPALERQAQQDRGHLLNWVEIDSSEADAAHVVLAPIPGSGEDSKELNQWIRSVHATREVAERKRLLYVACTRAREELHLFAAPETRKDGTFSVNPTSLLDTAWPVAEAYAGPGGGAEEEPFVFAIAAAAEPGLAVADAVRKPAMLYRLPLSFDPALRFAGHIPLAGAAPSPFAGPASRPEGSFAARAFGNVVHAFLDLAARRIATGATAEALRAELPAWSPRAGAVLRAAGLAPAMVQRESRRVIAALNATLASPEGRWILAAHPDAASEYELAAEPGSHAGLRLDRIFRGGATPQEPGDQYVWIVDYKTGRLGGDGIDAFLAEQRSVYSPQLNAYARTVLRLTAARGQECAGIRVGLFYPALPRFTWWVPGLGEGSPAVP